MKQDLVWTYKLLNNILFINLGQENDKPFYYIQEKSTRETRASQAALLWVPSVRLKARENSFLVRAARLWNTLPVATRSLESLRKFRRRIHDTRIGVGS